MTWRKVSSKTLFVHPRITLIEDTVELPGGTVVPYLVFGKRADSVSIICTKGNKVLLQKEYAYPTGQELYQFPGGKMESNESSIKGALRELMEEAGLKATNISLLGWFYLDNRRSDAKQFVYLANKSETVEKKGGDVEESITSHWTPISKVEKMIAHGEIVNYSLLAAWSIYKASLYSD